MPTIARRTIKGIPYYYLVHTIRDGAKFTQKTRYLGRVIPNDIVEIQKQFIFELDREKWFGRFAEIKKNYTHQVRLLPESARQQELSAFSVRFTYDSQRIEGSTLSLRETAQLLEKGISPNGRPIQDVKEAEAHREVFLEALGSETDLSLPLVLEWHWKMFRHTKEDLAGQIRKHGVKIAGSRFDPPSPVELQPMLTDFFRWYNKAKKVSNPVELAGLVHLRFVTIHPFGDGNGRISRLMMNSVLHRRGFPMLDIDYRRRLGYYTALERSQLKKNERIFLNWFFRSYLREFRKYLNAPQV